MRPLPPTIEALEGRLLLDAGLVGEYFDTIDLQDLATTRVDATVDFPQDWGNAPPGTAVEPDDNYSERWTGFVHAPQTGDWTFYTVSNDGVRLWVDGDQVIDHWNQHTATEDSAVVRLDAGWHPIRLEHFQQDGTAVIRLSFSGPGQGKVIVPSTHLSTTDPGAGDPSADAGPDQVLVLPDNSVTLHGSGGDPDGWLVARGWSKVSGPAATLTGAETFDLALSNLVEGTYVFRLTVTDNDGQTASGDATVRVLPEGSGEGLVEGELRTWHDVTVTFAGPATSETATPNPFTDYRLEVTFVSPSGRQLLVPGYYAADGDAADTGASAGDRWRVHLAPDEVGRWTYVASFRTGSNVAVSDDPDAGSSAGYFDGATGAFDVEATDKTGRDFRGKGRLEYVGEHYLRFAASGEHFLKCGADAPENFLAYEDFDGPFDGDGHKDDLVKDWAAHVRDWKAGDPTWKGDKGKGIIGAVNYLASEGLNAFSFLTLNINGDDQNVFPYTSYNERLRFDCSRLDQWDIVFAHADRMGMYLHFKTQETENELLLNSGNLGNQRKLYYRELIARFGHHLALNWNLGEEVDDASTSQKKAWARYFWDHDPYRHPIVIHNGDNHYDLLGPGSELTGFSLQTSHSNFDQVHSRTKDYIDRSAAAGKPWVVACDEPGDASHALRPDNDAGQSHVDGRKNALWGNLMAGGAGLEFYFGYQHAHSDLTCQDYRSRDAFWDYCRHALSFFHDNDIPFWEMVNDNGVSTASSDYGFCKPGEVYVVYLKNGGTTSVDLRDAAGTFDVRWYNPRNGGPLREGTVRTVEGGGVVGIGLPPSETGNDWVALLQPAEEIVLRPPDQPGSTEPGLAFEAFEGEWDAMPDFDALTPVGTGTSATPDLAVATASDRFGLRFTGFVQAPADGIYTFYVRSDDGGRLWIGETLVADNDGVHAARERSGTIGLAAGLHAVTVEFFEKTGDEALEVRWAGPGLAKQLLAPSALFRIPAGDTTPPQVEAVATNAGLGRYDTLLTLAVRFSEDVSSTLEARDLRLQDQATGGEVRLTGATVSWQAATNTATWDLSPSGVGPGRYTAVLRADSIADAAGNLLDGDGDGTAGGDAELPVLVTWRGDGDRDGTVGRSDFLALRAHFGLTVGATWAQGDSNGDAAVNYLDYVEMKRNIGRTLPGGEPAPTAAQTAADAPAEAPASEPQAVPPAALPYPVADGADRTKGDGLASRPVSAPVAPAAIADVLLLSRPAPALLPVAEPLPDLAPARLDGTQEDGSPPRLPVDVLEAADGLGLRPLRSGQGLAFFPGGV